MIAFVSGDSMSPSMGKINIVSIKMLKTKEAKAKLKVGDVILYVSKGYNRDGTDLGHKETVLHRITKIDSATREYSVKGDNRSYEESIKPEAIRGILEKVIA